MSEVLGIIGGVGVILALVVLGVIVFVASLTRWN